MSQIIVNLYQDLDLTDQAAVDKIMLDLDGTENKCKMTCITASILCSKILLFFPQGISISQVFGCLLTTGSQYSHYRVHLLTQ